MMNIFEDYTWPLLPATSLLQCIILSDVPPPLSYKVRRSNIIKTSFVSRRTIAHHWQEKQLAAVIISDSTVCTQERKRLLSGEHWPHLPHRISEDVSLRLGEHISHEQIGRWSFLGFVESVEVGLLVFFSFEDPCSCWLICNESCVG